MAAALWQGATLVTMPRFDLEQFLTILQDYRVTTAAVVPPIMLAMAKHPLVDRFDLSALRFLGSGAAPLGAELEEARGKRLGRAAAAQHRGQGRRCGHGGGAGPQPGRRAVL
jgi:acyl-CoA synthetase (AMP-forming)/AMP-acid ligase II